MTSDLLSREGKLLAWMKRHDKSMGVQWWSLRKMGSELGWAPSTVLATVHALERNGHIKIHHGPGNALGYTLRSTHDGGES